MTDSEKKLAFLLATSPYLDTLDGSYDKASIDLVANGVVPVVKCRDCKHWLKDVPGCTDFVGRCELANYMVGATGYCVYGDRKADDDQA